jgi:heme exporter protein D
MMPDLGKYAVEVGLAYVVSLALLALMVVFVWRRAAKARAALAAVEAQITRTRSKG